MKLFLPLFFFTLLYSNNLFSQNKIGQIAYAQWNVEEGKWAYHSFEDWTYDEEGRESFYAYRDSRYSDYQPTNNLKSISKYDGAGRLIETNNLHFGPNDWQNNFNQFSYDTNGHKVEKLTTYTSSYNDKKNISKYVFEIDDIENRRSLKTYWQDEAGNFNLRNQTDSIFNDQGCLTESSNFEYKVDGSVLYGREWKMEYTDDCQLLQSDFYRWDLSLESITPRDRYIYEYFNDGKLMIITFMGFNDNTNQWEVEHITETETNDEGETIRYFVESYRNNSIDSTLQLYTYTSRNEIETFQQYEMINTSEEKMFYRTRNDSFDYHYNLEDQIILKEEYRQNYENAVMRYYNTYEYYCNGQLKSEVRGHDVPYYRADYRYVGGADCPLEDWEEAMMVFPNPTSGMFTIQANVLANSETTIQVFTILGQEIFSKKINQTSYQHQIDLSNFEKGNYIVMISNSEEILSEKVIIF